jgi:hypothetical protein
MSLMKWFSVAISIAFLASGCASSKMKERREQREKVSQSSKLFCEFINGEIYPDVDVALNLEMAKRCDSDRPFTITQYKTPSENQGVLYCCSTAGGRGPAPMAVFEKTPKKDDKKDDKKDSKAKDEVE